MDRMENARAVFFLEEDADLSTRPLMLQRVLFCPILAWLRQQLRAEGIGRFFVWYPPESPWTEEFRACFEPEDDVTLSADREVLRTFLREKNIDVVIDVDIVLDVLSLPAARFLGTKVISWEHFNAEFELSVGYRRWILRYSLPRSDYVVVLTKADRDVYRDRLGRRERIAQIYNPLDKSDEAYDPHRKKQIVSVGRLVPQKGIDKLMRIAATVLRAHPDWQWLLLGEGEERAELERFIRETHLENRLILLGTVADVDAWLRQASILVSTSEYEGLGMNILEAKRRGVPCVSFAVPTGPQEIIRDGVDGYLVPPFDCDEMAGKINRLIEDPSLRERFARQALVSLGEFETTRVIGQWKRLLAELADGTR